MRSEGVVIGPNGVPLPGQGGDESVREGQEPVWATRSAGDAVPASRGEAMPVEGRRTIAVMKIDDGLTHGENDTAGARVS